MGGGPGAVCECVADHIRLLLFLCARWTSAPGGLSPGPLAFICSNALYFPTAFAHLLGSVGSLR